MSEIGTGNTGFAYLVDVLRHLVLPAVTMALFYLALYTRVMRTAMLEVFSLEYIIATQAKGLPERAIAWRHAVPNAILPVVTLAGIQFGHLLGGSILIETVFGWPGWGASCSMRCCSGTPTCCLKTEVWEVARQINRNAGREVIPNKIIKKSRRPNWRQVELDSDSLPPYELMDPIPEL